MCLLPSPPHGNFGNAHHFSSGMNVFQSMCETTPPGLCHHAKVTLAWCGKSANIVENVCRDGPRAFRTTDPGYFGGESYFAVECAYASRYASPKTAGGEYPVILFACCVSPLPYVITRKDNHDVPRCEVKGYSQFYAKEKEGSKSLMPRYNAHLFLSKILSHLIFKRAPISSQRVTSWSYITNGRCLLLFFGINGEVFRFRPRI